MSLSRWLVVSQIARCSITWSHSFSQQPNNDTVDPRTTWGLGAVTLCTVKSVPVTYSWVPVSPVASWDSTNLGLLRTVVFTVKKKNPCISGLA